MKKNDIFAAIAVTFFMSALDAVITLWGLRLGAIREANPLMAPLLMNNLLGFFAVKLITPVIIGLGFFIFRNQPRKFIVNLLYIVVIVYIVVIALHIRWMFVYFEPIRSI